MSEDDLKAIAARAEAATPGPWTPEYIDLRFGHEHCPGPVYPDDAAFIAAAREDVPQLVAEVRELRALATELAEALDDAKDFCPGTPSYPMAIWPALAKARERGLLT